MSFVYVHDGNVDRALREFQRRTSRDGILAEVKKRIGYMKPSAHRRAKHQKAVQRQRRRMARRIAARYGDLRVLPKGSIDTMRKPTIFASEGSFF
jgi:ribosomal protein S21